LNQLPPGFTLCQDHVFTAVFTKNTPQSRGALTSLLSAFLDRKLTLVSVTANEPAAVVMIALNKLGGT
jgi:hypothetical protein